MRLHWPTLFFTLGLALVLSGCELEPLELGVEIVDGRDILGESHSAFALRVRKDGKTEETRTEFFIDECDLRNNACSFSVRVDNPGQRDIWVEALDADKNVLVRSFNLSDVNRNNLKITATLYAPCQEQADCDVGDVNGNGCSPHECEMERCTQQGTLDDGEDCIIGTEIAGHCQSAACVPASCGDGILCSENICTSGPDSGVEECDAGSANSDSQADACRSNCALAFCGDGIRDAEEACDDGNTVGGDECPADCQ